DPFESSFPSERRLSEEILAAYGVKYARKIPSVRASKESRALLGLNWSEKWEDSLVIPIRDMSGRIVGFRNRKLSGSTKMYGPKEKHPLPVPPLYGLYEARSEVRSAGFVIVVEGEV